jgi:DNA-binding MarR family transcriptional regulator
MNGGTFQLNAADRVLLHLREYWLASSRLEFPSNITQKGIAEATGLMLTHVPRAIKRLRDDGLVREVVGHVEGERRRYKVYFLTDEGMRTATSMRAELVSAKVMVKRGGTLTEVTLAEALEMPGARVKLFEALDGIARDGFVDIGAPEKALAEGQKSFLGDAPPLDEFLDREEETRHLESFAESGKARLMVVIGGAGIGKTALARQFVERARRISRVGWINLHRATAPESLLASACDCLGSGEPQKAQPDEAGRHLARLLDAANGILVLDGYDDVPEQTVEMLQGMMMTLKPGAGAKLLMTMREDTPSYSRFYGRRDVESGAVEELHLRGLGLEDSKALLGSPEIDVDAMKRIYLLTKGSPRTLKMIAVGDVQRLREGTRFTNEEIRLLLFLKNVKASG